MASLTNLLLLAGAGYVGWKIWDSFDAQQKEVTGRPALWPYVVDAANAANVPVAILAGVVKAESSWSNAPNSHSSDCKVHCIASKACAVGVAQLLPSTAASMGVTGDLCDPANNLLAGARYLRQLYTKYGDWRTVAIAYNWGPGNVDSAIRNGKSFYSGSIDYADRVLAAATDYNGGEALAGVRFGAQTPAFHLFKVA